MRLSILVDNTGHDGFEAEHGFAALVEHNGHLVLFDNGTTDAMVRNAQRLGVDLKRVEVIALSHGHYDHTGGLEAALEATGPVRLVGHPAAFGEKTVKHGEGLRDAGMRLTRHELEVLGATVAGLWGMLSGELTSMDRGNSGTPGRISTRGFPVPLAFELAPSTRQVSQFPAARRTAPNRSSGAWLSSGLSSSSTNSKYRLASVAK